jgi:hypothetical protein
MVLEIKQVFPSGEPINIKPNVFSTSVFIPL